MSFDDPGEIERLRLELKKITAQRDHLLVGKSSSDSQTSQVKQPRATTNELVEEVPSPINATKKFDSPSLASSELTLTEKIWLYRSLFHGREDVYAILWQNKTTRGQAEGWC